MNNKNIIKLVLLVSLMSVAQLKADNMNKKIATFAGGCFWCVEQPFDKLKGVIESISGYTGGHEVSPTYEDVSAGTTGHLESVRIVYDPALIKYEQLLDLFWKQIDPTDPGGQFADRGHQYATAIFYHDEDQKKIAEKSKSKLDGSGIYGNPVVTRILPAGKFYAAEEYHQDYASKHPVKYKTYKHLSGRTPYIKKLWEKNIFETAAPQGRYQRPPDRKIKRYSTSCNTRLPSLTVLKSRSQMHTGIIKKKAYMSILLQENLFSAHLTNISPIPDGRVLPGRLNRTI